MSQVLTPDQRRAIARVVTRHQGNTARSTGFVVGPGLMLTAYHAVGDKSKPGIVSSDGKRQRFKREYARGYRQTRHVVRTQCHADQHDLIGGERVNLAAA